MPAKGASLFPYPAVQYIPLLTQTVVEGSWNPPAGLNRPHLTVGKNDPDWREFLRRAYQLSLPPLTLASGEILLLALGIKLLNLKYRGNFVTVIADLSPNHYQLRKMNQGIFYKERIIFEVFTQDGTRLCWEPWDKKTEPTDTRF